MKKNFDSSFMFFVATTVATGVLVRFGYYGSASMTALFAVLGSVFIGVEMIVEHLKN